jgi:oxygen-independent coproporphyrinogen-3 oxidase
VPLGVYISVPFCRTKCSYCNFASDVFSKSAFENYVRRVVEDIHGAPELAAGFNCVWDQRVDSIYLGGGTPSILDEGQLTRLFKAVREQFSVAADAEITVECAPGTLTPALIDALLGCGVNRVSLGVQSFVDQEARSVGRLHTRSTVLEEVDRLRAAGIRNINVDLIAGLPHQTAESWSYSLSETIALGAPHVSVYMLEVDEDSRLGRELIAGGRRYHAHFVPDEDATVDFYQQACEALNAAGVEQYEISNFARAGAESRHNLKYWTRQPYVGFGVDAHSMLRARGAMTSAAKAVNVLGAQIAALKRCATQKHSAAQERSATQEHSAEHSAAQERPATQEHSAAQEHSDSQKHSTIEERSVAQERSVSPERGTAQRRQVDRSPRIDAQSECGTESVAEAIRFSTPDSLDAYMNRSPHAVTMVSAEAAIEESFFLGLRLNRGVDLGRLRTEYSGRAIASHDKTIEECVREVLLEKEGELIRLTNRGRLLSNEVFARFLRESEADGRKE